ncbi:MAG: peptidylprolyl isomerase [Bacteroidales bacterium]
MEEFAQSENPVQYINLTADTRHMEVYQTIDRVSPLIRDFISSENMNLVYGPYVENETYKIARLLDVEMRPDSVHVRHILIAPNQTRTMEGARAEADSLLRVIKGGANFATLATSDFGRPGFCTAWRGPWLV